MRQRKMREKEREDESKEAEAAGSRAEVNSISERTSSPSNNIKAFWCKSPRFRG